MNPLTPLELGMSEGGSYRVIGNSGNRVIEKQMANGNQQLARAKMIPIGMFRLTPLELGMSEGGSHRVIGKSGNRVIEKQMAISAKERGQKRSKFQSRKGLKYLRNAVCFQ